MRHRARILDAVTDDQERPQPNREARLGRQAPRDLTVIFALFAFIWQHVVVVAIVALAALCFAFLSGAPRRREAPAVGKTLSIVLGVVVIVLGVIVCLVALMFFAFHGYQQDYDSGRANTIWFAVPTLALAIGLMAPACDPGRRRSSYSGAMCARTPGGTFCS